jgi:hypothetical protein
MGGRRRLEAHPTAGVHDTSLEQERFAEWLRGADPVLAWIEACVDVIDPKSPDWDKARIKSAEAHTKFMSWAKREGFRENTLPAISGFAQRLRANRPSIETRHVREGNFLTGMRIISPEGETDFFPQ